MLRALAALGHAHVADPDQRPNGPVEQDLPSLLGALLSLVETETSTVVDPQLEPPQSFAGFQEGWRHTSADRDVHRAVMINRLQRTAFDVPVILADFDVDDEESPGPPGVAGASPSAMAGASLIDAQEHFDNGRLEHALLALDSAEGSLAQALLCLYLLPLQVRASGLQ